MTRNSEVREARADEFDLQRGIWILPADRSKTKKGIRRALVVAETFSMTEHELSQYCREKGLYPEQVTEWLSECMQGFMSQKEREAEAKKQTKTDKREVKELKKELRYKEKALAETTALLVLRKKRRAFYGEEPEDD